MSFLKSPADIKSAVERAKTSVETLAAELAPHIGKEPPGFNMAAFQDFVLAFRQWYAETADSWFSMNSGNTYDTAEQWHERAIGYRKQAYAAGLLKHAEDSTDLPPQKDPIGSDYVKPAMLLFGVYLLARLLGK